MRSSACGAILCGADGLYQSSSGSSRWPLRTIVICWESDEMACYLLYYITGNVVRSGVRGDSHAAAELAEAMSVFG